MEFGKGKGNRSMTFLWMEVLSIHIMGVEPKIGAKKNQNGWLISWKTLLTWDDLGVPLFLETPIYP